VTAKRIRLQPDERRPLLLDAAERTFGRLGFEATRIEDVAKEAGVAKGLLYRHFVSKEALFSAVMQYKAERFTGRVLQRFAEEYEATEGDPWALVVAGLGLWMDEVTSDVNEQRWLVAPGSDDAYRPFRDATRAMLVAQFQAFAPELDAARAALIAAAFEGAIEALSLAWTAQPDAGPTHDEALHLLVAFCLRGLDGVRQHLDVDLPPAPPVPPSTTDTSGRGTASRSKKKSRTPSESGGKK